jgi:hypothetical protein
MTRIFGLLALAALACFVAACHPGVGERCNPLRFTDDCPSGTACTYPASCGVAYCCPTVLVSDPSTITIPNCMACPTDDAGTTDDGGATD